MITIPTFVPVRRSMLKSEQEREEAIALSRSVIHISKLAINSVHRKEFSKAKKHLADLSRGIKRLQTMRNNPEALKHVRIAEQEYVEAACFFAVMSKSNLPSQKELHVDATSYLEGLCDLSGEVGRKIVMEATEGNIDKVKELKKFAGSLYTELLGFDLRNGELRRKFDRVKYDIKKIEEIDFQLSSK